MSSDTRTRRVTGTDCHDLGIVNSLYSRVGRRQCVVLLEQFHFVFVALSFLPPPLIPHWSSTDCCFGSLFLFQTLLFFPLYLFTSTGRDVRGKDRAGYLEASVSCFGRSVQSSCCFHSLSAPYD
jgi:hypothetical protein